MKTLAGLCVSLMMVSAASALERAPHLNVVHRQADAKVLVKRNPEPQFSFTFELPGNTRTNSATLTSTTPRPDDDESSTTTSTTSRVTTESTTRTTSRSTRSESSTTTFTSTSTTSTSSTISTPTTTTTSTTSTPTAAPRTSSPTNTGTTFTVNNVASSRSIRSTSTSESPTATSSSSTPSSKNKAAITATAVIASLVGTAALAFIGFWLWRKSHRGKMGDDTWDVPEATEHTNTLPSVKSSVLPPPVMAYGTSNTAILPSQSLGAGALARSRSNYTQPSHRVDRADDPDEIMSLPPVANYERPRDSAFDIVPAAPPTAFYSHPYTTHSNIASSSSTGLAVPRSRGQLTSFGSDVGGDPFAGNAPMEGERESMYGAGQAGRGAGFKMAGNDHPTAVNGAIGLGSQWPQGYNPHTGYSQGYGGPYGYSS